MKTTTISRNIDITLTTEEELAIIRKWAKEKPEVLQILLENPKGHCTFPDDCNMFPCKTLTCNADCCDNNGYTYRMS